MQSGTRMLLLLAQLFKHALITHTQFMHQHNRSRTDTNKTLESKRFRVDSGRFQQIKVTEDCELQEFIESHCKLPFKSGCAFFEFINKEEDISEKKEVLLMDKVILQSDSFEHYLSLFTISRTLEIFLQVLVYFRCQEHQEGQSSALHWTKGEYSYKACMVLDLYIKILYYSIR